MIFTFKVSEVRAVLMSLARLAEKYGVAVVGNAHMNKATQQAVAYRIGASIAFRAVARSAFYVAPDPNDQSGYRHLLFHDKSNVAVKRPPRGYAIVAKDGVGVVAWDRDPVTCTLVEALSAGLGQSSSRNETEAERFFKEILASGPVNYRQIKLASAQQDIKDRTLDRAKSSLGVRSIKQGYGKDAQTFSALPETAAAQSVPAVHSLRPLASNGTDWHPLPAEVIPFPSNGRQRAP